MATPFNAVYDFARRSGQRLQKGSPVALQFLRRLRNPAMIGAVAPSSRALAELIVSGIDPDSTAILEVGAGTGVFTAALIDRGIKPEALTVIEADPVFATILRQRFPGVEIVNGLVEEVLGKSSAGAERRFTDVISGLPLLNFPMRTRRRILTAIFAQLEPHGSLYQFTYGPKAPVDTASLIELGLVAEPVGRVWRNLPPATVYRIRRN